MLKAMDLNAKCKEITLKASKRQLVITLSLHSPLHHLLHQEIIGAEGDAAAAVMYTMMGCCKAAEVNVEQWLTYFLEHVHDYDNDYSRDLAELLPSELKRKGLIA